MSTFLIFATLAAFNAGLTIYNAMDGHKTTASYHLGLAVLCFLWVLRDLVR